MKVKYNYYYDGDTREICHEIKQFNQECLEIMANYFLNQNIITKDTILIPAPQHQGYSIYTKEIANIIEKESGASVKDIIVCNPRKTLYEMKQNKEKQILNFHLKEELELTSSNIFLIDNVLDTGLTYLTCQKLFKQKIIPLVYGCTNKNLLVNKY